MWEAEVEPRLREAGPHEIIVSRTLKVLGLGESAAEQKVADLMSGANPTLAPYAKQDGIHLRITAKAASREGALPLIADLESRVRERLGSYVYGADDDTPWGVARDLLGRIDGTCAFLEIGEAQGSIAELERAATSAGTLATPSLEVASRLLGETATATDLEQAALQLGLNTGALVIVAVAATSEPDGRERGTVRATGEAIVLAPAFGGELSIHRARQNWKTSASEVQRLVGLAAVSLLFRSLSQKGQGQL
jgi:hypothetical protein